jgi:hypothetical protein
MTSSIKDKLIHTIQKILLNLSFFAGVMDFTPNKKGKKGGVWVVGTGEVAGMTKMIANAIPNSYSVVLEKNRFYNYNYNFQGLALKSHVFSRLLFYITGPVLLGYLASRVYGFIYVGSSGFLISQVDSREYEFRFLKSHGKKVVCYLTGADIRSPLKMRLAFEKSGEENYGNYIPFVNSVYDTDDHESRVKEVARVVDKYSDAFFNAEYDQAAHLNRKAHAFMYFFSLENIDFNNEKYNQILTTRIRILHAPSSPVLKGTPVVRTVIRMLQNEGFKFEYVELTNSPNSQILERLHDSHIVINELYAFMPGVFAIEAMAMSCVVLTRADSLYETQLPASSNDAWVVTPAYALYTNLKKLLENPSSLEIQARKGFDWVRENSSLQACGPKLNSILKDL